jgi:hypothetical protein
LVKETDNQFQAGVKQYRESQMIEVRLSSPHSREESPSVDSDGFRRTVTMSFGPKSIIDTNRLNYLARPKQEYDSLDVFKHQEFRGLLHADHKEAVSIA